MTTNNTTESSGDGTAAKPRVFTVSQRNVRHMAAWCSLYEFEDVICDIDDVDRIDLAPGRGFSWREHAVTSLVWRQFSPLSARLNPGLKPVSVEREYDLFFFGCVNPWELLYLNAVRGWKEKCRKKVCFMYEMWGGIVQKYRHLLGLLNDFDHVILGTLSSVQPVQEVVEAPCHHVSPGVDTLRFSPYPNPPARCIDVYSLGRRVESMHHQLLEMSRKRELFYIYDTIPARCLQPPDHRQHRDLFANLAKRSRFFVTYPGKVDRKEETRGLSEPGMRFYEGVVSGAVLVGEAPESDAFKREFNWPDSVISVGERIDDLIEVMARFEREPQRFEQLSRTNALEGLKRHDYAYRWDDILRIAGQPPTAKLARRKDHLSRLAAMASETSAPLVA